ncbi:hypothetical protein SH449x_001208 [Pirellulaceae bacterium SH449]
MQLSWYESCGFPRKQGKMPVRSQEVCSHGLADLSFDSTYLGRGVNGIIGAESVLNRRSGSAEKLLQWLEPLLFPMIPPIALGGHPSAEFATVLIRTPDDNSVLTLEAPEKREPESSGLIFRTGGRNLEGCIRETVAVTNACLSGGDKEKLLRSLDRASRFVRLPRLFAFTGLSSSRYYDWKNAQECGLDDVSSCPKSSPGQMTATERSEMRSMVQSEAYRHLSVGSIARLAARLGKVYACSSTWYRAIQNGN